jgi:hypothetical protein
MRAQSFSFPSNDDSKRFLSLSRVPTTSTQLTAGWLAGRQCQRMDLLAEALAVAFLASSGLVVLFERGVRCGREVNP